MAIELDMTLVRHFLRTAIIDSGEALVRKACDDGEPAAIQLLLLGLKVRVNKRTRRTFAHVRSALRLEERPRWLRVLMKRLYALYNCLRGMAVPMNHAPVHPLRLSRHQQRALQSTGAVVPDRRTLHQKSNEAASKLHSPDNSLTTIGCFLLFYRSSCLFLFDGRPPNGGLV